MVERKLGATGDKGYPGPDQIPYRSDLLAALGAIKTIWSLPGYTLDIARLAMPELDLSESTMMWILGYRGPLRPMDLAFHMAMGRSNVSKVVNRLEDKGLVERRAAESDKRSVRVHLTEQGERACRRLYEAGDMQMDALTEGWSEEELRQFSAYATRFAESARQLAERLSRGEIPPVPDDRKS